MGGECRGSRGGGGGLSLWKEDSRGGLEEVVDGLSDCRCRAHRWGWKMKGRESERKKEKKEGEPIGVVMNE